MGQALAKADECLQEVTFAQQKCHFPALKQCHLNYI